MSYLVSIIMPTYNNDSTISASIESVIQQTYKNWELLVINDGSIDETEEIVSEFAARDSRIKLVSIPNGGVSNARNTGIQMAAGKYIMFVDADDLYMDFSLFEMVSAIEDQEVDLACGGYELIENNRDKSNSKIKTNPIGTWDIRNMYESIFEMQRNQTFNTVWNKIFKREIIVKNNILMDVTCDIGEDLLFVIEYLKYCSKVVLLDKIIYRYYFLDSGLSKKNRDNIFEIRIDQLNQLLSFYNERMYDRTYLYDEYLRMCYLSIAEINRKESYNSFKLKKDYINKVINTPIIHEVIYSNYNTSSKFDVFRRLLRTKSSQVILFFVGLFYKWH